MDWRAFSVPVEGALLSGELRGEGTPLVLIHGFAGSRAMWDRVVNALPADLSLLRYDLRGFGASSQDEAVEFSHAEDLIALLNAHGIERATLAGISLGGGIAANFALNHPDRTERLILVSPMLMGWEWSDDWRQRWRASSQAARAGDLDLARQLWWDHPLFASVRTGDAGDDLHREIDAFACRQWVRDPQRRVMPDVERLHALTRQTLLLTGGLDLPDFRLMADALEASAPNLRRIDYADCGHMLTLEQPVELAAEIRDFSLA